MTARESSWVHPNHKTKYRVWNWREYETELCKRGDLTVWISPGAIKAWTPEPTGRRAAQPRYSDLAIETSLTLGKLFHLPLRQTEGFVRSVLQLLGVDLKAPDHSTLSRRNKTVEIPQAYARCTGPVQLIVDSTGLKMCGSGEWRREKWGKTRRDWRKLHLGVDKKGLIVVSVFTESGAEDAATVQRLLGPLEVPIQRFTGDGAYDKVSVYEQLDKTGTDDIEVVIPPRKDGVESDPTGRSRYQRNAAIKRIQEIGRRAWEKESGYREQGRVENTFHQFKRIFGATLRSQSLESQERETQIAIKILNRMFDLGRPVSEAIAA